MSERHTTIGLVAASVVALASSFARAQEPPPALPEGQVAVPLPPAPPPAGPAAVAAPPRTVPPEPTPEPCPPPPEDRWEDERGARLTGGVAFTEDLAHGAFGRLEIEQYSLKNPDENWIGGVLVGLDGWGSKDGGGGGIPMVMFTGFREDRSVFATIGGGWYWALYDRIHDDGGFGIFAPIAVVTFGVDIEGVRILADGRATYRWQWDAPDVYQLMAGLTFSVTSDH